MIPVVLSAKTWSTTTSSFLIRHDEQQQQQQQHLDKTKTLVHHKHQQWKPFAKSMVTSPSPSSSSSLKFTSRNTPIPLIGNHERHHDHHVRHRHHHGHDTCRSIRGGAADTAATAAGTSALLAITKLTDYIAATKLRCWTVLGIAILIEIASTTLLNVATLEKSPTKLAIAMIMYMTSLMAFATSLPQIDVSIAYAVWSACGTALVSVVMILWFGEAADPIKLACLAFIILGVVGLNLRDTMM